MSKVRVAPTPTERKFALWNAPGFFDVQRAQAALWLLDQFDDGDDRLTRFDPPRPLGIEMTAADMKSFAVGIVMEALAKSLADAAKAIAKAATQTDSGQAVAS